jgi:hypothetical protein
MKYDLDYAYDVLCMLSDELILEKLEYTEKEKSELNEIEK